MIPLGVAIATSTLIGNLLGANDPTSAKRVAKFGVITAPTTQHRTLHP